MPLSLSDRQHTGAAAEDAACAQLQANGLQLLARNARYPFGEIDLIFRDGPTVVFVEVRFRKSMAFGGAAGSVDAHKRRKIALAAHAWLANNSKFSKMACRFDIMAVIPCDGALSCDWLRAAFTLDDLAN